MHSLPVGLPWHVSIAQPSKLREPFPRRFQNATSWSRNCMMSGWHCITWTTYWPTATWCFPLTTNWPFTCCTGGQCTRRLNPYWLDKFPPCSIASMGFWTLLRLPPPPTLQTKHFAKYSGTPTPYHHDLYAGCIPDLPLQCTCLPPWPSYWHQSLPTSMTM